MGRFWTMRSPKRLRNRSSAISLVMKSAFLISGIDWIFCSSAAFCASVAVSLTKTSIMTRFLRLVAP